MRLFKFLASFLMLSLMVCLCLSISTVSFAQDSTITGGAGTGGDSFGNFLKDNWVELAGALLVFLEVVFRLTPSEKDNSIFNFIKKLWDLIIPNVAAKEVGGGKFGFLPPRDATTKNVTIKDIETGEEFDPKTKEVVAKTTPTVLANPNLKTS